MRVLTINCGSSSLKFDLLEVSSQASQRIAQGAVERLGNGSHAWLQVGDRVERSDASAVGHAAALRTALEGLHRAGVDQGIDVIAHRVVHGGPQFREATLIDDSVMSAIEQVSELAPLHNRPALEAIRAARDMLGQAIPMVAMFDTSFFSDLPDVAREYALPRELRENLQIRRYGFHGLAHRYMIQRYRQLRPAVEAPRLISLQLGSGCSATASRDGKPLDTSMGFTPLEGLIMGTRSGDIDPMLPLLLVERGGMSVDEVEALLNKRSGLQGLSGLSDDMRDLQHAAAAGDKEADMAVRAFVYRIQKYVGAYLAILGGAEGIIFGGGIGERSPDVRRSVCAAFEWHGVSIDSGANNRPLEMDTFVSSVTSTTEILVVLVDEAQVMAADAQACLTRPSV